MTKDQWTPSVLVLAIVTLGVVGYALAALWAGHIGIEVACALILPFVGLWTPAPVHFSLPGRSVATPGTWGALATPRTGRIQATIARAQAAARGEPFHWRTPVIDCRRK